METTLEKKTDVIKEGLNNMYNLAVDHAIETIRDYGNTHWKLTQPDLMAEDVIKQLKVLKK